MGSIETSMEVVLSIKQKYPSMITKQNTVEQQRQNKNINTGTDNRPLLDKNLNGTTSLPIYCDMANSQNSGTKDSQLWLCSGTETCFCCNK
jgi:hypothetical protein